MKKTFLRDVNPNLFTLIKDKDLYYDIGMGSPEAIEFICPRCGCVITQSVRNANKRGLSCKRCGDGISYGEKFIFNLLDQLNICFDTHVCFEWSNKRSYDAVVYDVDTKQIKYLIEVQGKQHFLGGFESYGGRSRNEEIENDEYKRQLALDNGFSESKYIEIDCLYSDAEYIKMKITEHPFFSQYNLSVVDWSLCATNALSSYAIKAQEMWDCGSNITDISTALKISRQTIRRYLKAGAKLGICSYSVGDSFHRRRLNTFVPAPKTIMVGSNQLRCVFYSGLSAAKYVGLKTPCVIYKTIRGEALYSGKTADGEPITWFQIDTVEELERLVNEDGFVLIGDPPKSTIVKNV